MISNWFGQCVAGFLRQSIDGQSDVGFRSEPFEENVCLWLVEIFRVVGGVRFETCLSEVFVMLLSSNCGEKLLALSRMATILSFQDVTPFDELMVITGTIRYLCDSEFLSQNKLAYPGIRVREMNRRI